VRLLFNSGCGQQMHNLGVCPDRTAPPLGGRETSHDRSGRDPLAGVRVASGHADWPLHAGRGAIDPNAASQGIAVAVFDQPDAKASTCLSMVFRSFSCPSSSLIAAESGFIASTTA
jgi:hypothetical protein